MNVLIACDKFKGSLGAQEVCDAIATGLTQQDSRIKCTSIPLADGGDGTMQLLQQYLNLKDRIVQSIDPLGRLIDIRYYHSDSTAYIELAEISGITRLKNAELNPLSTTTIGTGQVIQNAIDLGCSNIVLGLGGSCTNDAGLGIACALGYTLVDRHGRAVVPSGGTLNDITEIQSPVIPQGFDMTILCDVDNPLYGPQGAAYIYAPQKGAKEADIALLDQGLRNVSTLIKTHYSKDVSKIEGGGAAGGIAAGMVGLFNAKIQRGFDYLNQLNRLEEYVQQADVVITGEGLLDHQSLHGKVIGQMINLCSKYNKPLIAVVGDCLLDTLDMTHFHSVHRIMSKANNLSDAMHFTKEYLTDIGMELNLHVQL